MALRYGAIGTGPFRTRRARACVGRARGGEPLDRGAADRRKRCLLADRPTLLPASRSTFLRASFSPPEPTLIEGLDKPTFFPVGPPGQVSVAMEGERSTALSTAFEIFRGRAWRTPSLREGLRLRDRRLVRAALGLHVSRGAVGRQPRAQRAASDRGVARALDDLCTDGPTAEEPRRRSSRRPASAGRPVEHPRRAPLFGDRSPPRPLVLPRRDRAQERSPFCRGGGGGPCRAQEPTCCWRATRRRGAAARDQPSTL